jgi:uroporphyrin-III C-methyltransferase
MGLGKLDEITETFKSQGKQDTAVAIIQDGSLPTEKIALGTIDTIRQIAEAKKITAPAVIVIGDVVKLHGSFPASLSDWNYLLN